MFRGMSLTLKYFFEPKVTVSCDACLACALRSRKLPDKLPLREGSAQPPLPRRAPAAALRFWRGAVHRLQAVRSGEYKTTSCPAQPTANAAPLQVCPAQAITIEAEEREDGSRRTTRYDIDMSACSPGYVALAKTKSPHSKMHLLRLLPGGVPRGRHCGGAKLRVWCVAHALFHPPSSLTRPRAATETHEELLYDKERLLANGDRWESEVAANLHAERLYR